MGAGAMVLISCRVTMWIISRDPDIAIFFKTVTSIQKGLLRFGLGFVWLFIGISFNFKNGPCSLHRLYEGRFIFSLNVLKIWKLNMLFGIFLYSRMGCSFPHHIGKPFLRNWKCRRSKLLWKRRAFIRKDVGHVRRKHQLRARFQGNNFPSKRGSFKSWKTLME